MSEKSPQPQNPEILIAQGLCQKIRELSKNFPKLDSDKKYGPELREGNKNNFYFIFQQNKNKKIGKFDEEIWTKDRLDRLEGEFKEQWRKFLEENSDLIRNIEQILGELDITREAESFSIDLIKMGIRNEEIEIMERGVLEEVRLGEVQNYIWSRLNPLLNQAWEKMKEYGIPPEEFFR